MSDIYFISRHELTPAQRATLKGMGYHNPERKEIIFVDPIIDVRHLPCDALAIVAPLWVGVDLLNEGYEIIEFRNRPSSRAKGVFICEGATRFRLDRVAGKIESVFIASAIPPEEQEEVPAFSVIS